MPQNVEASRAEIRAFCLWMDKKDIMYLAICVDCLVKLGKCTYTGSEYHTHEVQNAREG